MRGAGLAADGAGGIDPLTTQDDLLAFLQLCDGAGAAVWLDGGWACDALLGRQTRPHSDVDIVVEERHLEALVGALRGAGYGDVPRDDTQPWNFVLGDAEGRQVDFHVVALDGEGNGLYAFHESEVWYPAASLAGAGRIGGRAVRCIAPDWLVRFHLGYPPEAEDRADVAALCSAFGIPVPDEYASFVEDGTRSRAARHPRRTLG